VHYRLCKASRCYHYPLSGQSTLLKTCIGSLCSPLRHVIPLLSYLNVTWKKLLLQWGTYLTVVRHVCFKQGSGGALAGLLECASHLQLCTTYVLLPAPLHLDIILPAYRFIIHQPSPFYGAPDPCYPREFTAKIARVPFNRSASLSTRKQNIEAQITLHHVPQRYSVGMRGNALTMHDRCMCTITAF
jgi:hypothetical protein